MKTHEGWLMGMRRNVLLGVFAWTVCACAGLPSGYQALEWIRATSAGKQWIHTGYVPDGTDRVEARVRFLVNNVNHAVFFSRDADAKNSFSCFNISSRYRFDYNNETSNGWGDRTVLDNEDLTIVCDGATRYAYVNDEIVYYYGFGGTCTPVAPITLFASHADGVNLSDETQPTNPGPLILYSFKVFNQQGTATVDMVPCRRESDGALGVYDRVRNVFCENKGTGENFLAGPSRAWLEEPSVSKTEWNRRTDAPGTIRLGEAGSSDPVTCSLTNEQLAALPAGTHAVVFTAGSAMRTIYVTVRDPFVCRPDASGATADFTFPPASVARTLTIAWANADQGVVPEGWTQKEEIATVPAGVDHLDDVVLPAACSAGGLVLRAFLSGEGAAVARPSARDYVRDGLVLQYDALENAGWGLHDPSTTTWVDLVGGRDLALTADDAVEGDAVLIGLSNHLVPGGALFADHVDATFECDALPVSERSEGGSPFLIIPYIGSMIWVPNETVFNTRRPQGSAATAQFLYQSYTTGCSSFDEMVKAGVYHTFSVAFLFGPDTSSQIPVYVDGVRQSLGSLNFLNYTRTGDLTLTIGNANNQTRFRSIRIYNRPLSEAEVLHNRQIDARRFGDGTDADGVEASEMASVPRAPHIGAVCIRNRRPASFDMEVPVSDTVRTLHVVWGRGDAGAELSAWTNAAVACEVPAGVASVTVPFPSDLDEPKGGFRAFLLAGRTVSARDYVQSGLVAQWDGIENAGYGVHNAQASSWKDLIGTNDLALTASDAVGGDHVFICNAEHKTPYALFAGRVNATFECNVLPVAEMNASGSAFLIIPYVGSLIWYPGAVTLNTRRPQGSSSAAKYLYQSYRTGMGSFEEWVGSGRYMTLSAVFWYGATTGSPLPFYVDGAQQEMSGDMAFINYNANNHELMLTLGHANNQTRFRSVRIYNRPLAAAEIAANAQVDAARFDRAVEVSAFTRFVTGTVIYVR